MQVKIKKLHTNAVIPSYSKPGDAGLDLTCISVELDQNGCYVYKTGIALEIPDGFFGLLVPRSSNSKKSLILTNHAGIVDSGYRGELMFKYKPDYQFFLKDEEYQNKSIYQVGDRVGQLIVLPFPPVEFNEVEELSESERGEGGYGSTGV
jgi:dUTP pyrophosphatase